MSKLILLAIFALGAPHAAAADEQAESSVSAAPECQPLPKPKARAREVKSGKAFMTLVMQLEGQGKGNMVPEFEQPETLCRIESYETENLTISAHYAPWEKGMQTLHYSFFIEGEEAARQIWVLYNGMLGFLQGDGFYFYVVETKSGNTPETRNGVTSYYAIYDNQPSYKTLRKLVSKIARGKKLPLVEVIWPDSEEELLITTYDSKRLN